MPTGVKAVGKDGTNGVNGTSCSIKVDDSSDPVIVIITNTDADGKETDTEISFPLYRTFISVMMRKLYGMPHWLLPTR